MSASSMRGAGESSRAPWEVELVGRRVLEITCFHYGCRPEEATLDWRFGEELRGDSLDAVGYLLELEEAFQITLSDEVADRWFPRQPFPLRHLVDVVLALSGTGPAERPEWTGPRP